MAELCGPMTSKFAYEAIDYSAYLTGILHHPIPTRCRYIAWLLEQVPWAQTGTLDIGGRNTVVWANRPPQEYPAHQLHYH